MLKARPALVLSAALLMLLGVVLLAFSRKQPALKVFGTLCIVGSIASAIAFAAIRVPDQRSAVAVAVAPAVATATATSAPPARNVTWADQPQVQTFYQTEPPSRIRGGGGGGGAYQALPASPSPIVLAPFVQSDGSDGSNGSDGSDDSSSRFLQVIDFATHATQTPAPAAPTHPYDSVLGAIVDNAPSLTTTTPLTPPPHVPYWAHLPTPEQIRMDREQALNRVDTPAQDWQRRKIALQEAAAMLRPSRDGFFVPLETPPPPS